MVRSVWYERSGRVGGAPFDRVRIYGLTEDELLYDQKHVNLSELCDAICVHLVGKPRKECEWWLE